ncbi:MAG: ribbon-helix-helix protein, CopG family [Syntrophobacteraceae bacterium]|jgi:uncharacterized protein (DUF1778 family)
MSVSARLDENTDAMLARAAKLLQTTKSEVLKRSIREYCGRILEEKSMSPYN